MLKVYVAQNIRAASPVANLNAGVDKAGLIYSHDRRYDCVRHRTTCETIGHNVAAGCYLGQEGYVISSVFCVFVCVCVCKLQFL